MLQENKTLPSFESGQDDLFDEAPLDALYPTPDQHDSLGNGVPGARVEGLQEPSLFNLDNSDSACPTPPLAMLNDLASVQQMIEQIKNASFSDEEDQWSSTDFESFIHPPHEQFRLDDPQLHLSVSIYISLSAHSSEATYEAV